MTISNTNGVQEGYSQSLYTTAGTSNLFNEEHSVGDETTLIRPRDFHG